MAIGIAAVKATPGSCSFIPCQKPPVAGVVVAAGVGLTVPRETLLPAGFACICCSAGCILGRGAVGVNRITACFVNTAHASHCPASYAYAVFKLISLPRPVRCLNSRASMRLFRTETLADPSELPGLTD